MKGHSPFTRCTISQLKLPSCGLGAVCSFPIPEAHPEQRLPILYPATLITWASIKNVSLFRGFIALFFLFEQFSFWCAVRSAVCRGQWIFRQCIERNILHWKSLVCVNSIILLQVCMAEQLSLKRLLRPGHASRAINFITQLGGFNVVARHKEQNITKGDII